jgi:hypothetical protein
MTSATLSNPSALPATEAWPGAASEARYRTLFDAIDEGFCIGRISSGKLELRHQPVELGHVCARAMPASICIWSSR